MIVGTFMTLFVIPVLYTVFEMIGERRRLRRTAAAVARASDAPGQ
jgi:hypothetical protein